MSFIDNIHEPRCLPVNQRLDCLWSIVLGRETGATCGDDQVHKVVLIVAKLDHVVLDRLDTVWNDETVFDSPRFRTLVGEDIFENGSGFVRRGVLETMRIAAFSLGLAMARYLWGHWPKEMHGMLARTGYMKNPE